MTTIYLIAMRFFVWRWRFWRARAAHAELKAEIWEGRWRAVVASAVKVRQQDRIGS